jgi:AAHS family 4-hydroxybenzoate transporter-like MFS transporter
MDIQGAQASPVSRLIDNAPWSGFEIAMLVLGATAFIMEGIANQLIGLSIPALMRAWDLPREPFAWLAATGLLGVAAGNALGGILGDALGRRRGIILSILAFGAMDVLAAFAVNIPTLAAIRFIAGIGLGAMIPNTATLIAEFTPQRRRAFAVSIGMLFIPLGIVIAGFMAAWILPHYGWRVLFAAGGVAPLTIAILFLFLLPETPRYLARDAANREPLISLLHRMGIAVPAGADLAEPWRARERTGAAALFAPAMRRDTLALWGIAFFGYMTSYVILTWAPAMLAGQGLSLAVTSKSLSAWSLGGFGSPLIGLAMQRWGSRVAICGFALAGAFGTLIMMTLPLSEDRIVWFMLMLFVENLFVVSLLTSVYVLGTHIYPASHRATGTGAASAVGRLGAMTSSFTTVYALHWGGPAGYFGAMGLTSLLTFVCAMALKNHVPPNARLRRAAAPQSALEAANT